MKAVNFRRIFFVNRSQLPRLLPFCIVCILGSFSSLSYNSSALTYIQEQRPVRFQRIYYRNNRIILNNTSLYNRAPTTWEQLIQSKLKGQTRIEGLYKYMTLRSVNIILHIHIHLKVQNCLLNMSRWHESWSQDQFFKDCWFEQAANRQVGFGKQQKPAWMHQKCAA